MEAERAAVEKLKRETEEKAERAACEEAARQKAKREADEKAKR